MSEPEMAGLGAAESEVLSIVWELKEVALPSSIPMAL